MKPGSRVGHDRFCVVEGWSKVRDARGQPVRHHVTYELMLPDGRVLRTRISHSVNKESYGPNLWATILRDQLQVPEGEFWACVRNKVKPVRGTPAPAPKNALPADLVWQLLHQAGRSQQEIAGMSLEQAIAAMNDWWSRPSS